jgi:HEAT repeat protein
MPRILPLLLLLLASGGALALPLQGARMTGVLEDDPAPVAAPTLRAPFERSPLRLPPATPLEARPDSATEPAAPTTLPPVLARMTRSEDPELRRRSIEGISTLPPHVAATHLLLLAADPDPEVRAAAIQGMGSLDAAATRDKLLDLMSTEEGAALLNADGVLQPLGPSLGAGMLELFLDASATDERRALAAYCLGQMRYADAVHPLRNALWSDTSNLAYASLDALYWIDDPRMEQDWMRLAEYQDPWVQAYAAAALARTASTNGIDTLFKLAAGLLTTDRAVQEQALNGLSNWTAEISLPYLIEILRSNPVLEGATIDALRKVAGVDVGKYPASWFEWYRVEKAAMEAAQKDIENPPPLMPDEGGNSIMNNVDFVPPGFSP